MRNPLRAYLRFLIEGFIIVGVIGAIVIFSKSLISPSPLYWERLPLLPMSLGLSGIFTAWFLYEEGSNLSERDKGFFDAISIALILAAMFTWNN